MNLYDAAWQLSDLLETNRAVFLRTEPDVPDHTIKSSFKCLVYGTNQHLEWEVEFAEIRDLIAQFDYTIFDKEKVERLYVWNFKSLCTYFHAVTGKYMAPTNNIIDLKVIENFLGIKKNRPENLIEAINRTKLALQYKGWQSIYRAVHLPLSLKVLPSIEATPLLNEEAKRSEFPYYEIEGQANGRMNCMKKFAKSYLPHNMGPDVRKALKPKGYAVRFLYADYRHCEVSILQYLSGDTKLEELMDSGEDLHAAIYRSLTGDTCNTDMKRNMSKMIFLPFMYGCGIKGMAKNISVSEDVAKELIGRIKNMFPMACKWMQDQQDKAKIEVATDYFGRPRKFPEDEAYRARDFSVQGVAATVCQEKLIELFNALDHENEYIAFTVHDGYGLVCNVNSARQTYRKVKDVLESESKLCPGLKMKVQIKFGVKLDKMKELWKD